MPRIFGRDVALEHPLEAKLAPFDGAQSADRFVAENWRYDWRVSKAREQIMVGHTCASGTSSDLKTCYRRYYSACICAGTPCEYVHDCNGPNLVTGPLRRDAWLCRVVCLNTFFRAARESIPAARELSDLDAWASWLTDEITGAWRRRGILGVRDVLSRLFQAWNNWSKLDKRPVWASFWADAEPFMAVANWPDAVRDAFGLGGFGVGSWVVLLRYQVKDIGSCYRPTGLDADWQPWHVLSPPKEPFGYTMDISPRGGRCCPEIIHAPIPLDIAHWTGHIDSTTTSPGESDLEALRARHYRALRARFPLAGSSWLP